MTEQESQTIACVAEEVKGQLSGESSGHDWWHVYRVWKMAERLAQEENANMFICSLAALVHDIEDWKAHGGDETIGVRAATVLLEREGVAGDTIAQITDIMSTMSYKGAGVATPMSTLEGKVVQDADRLDAMGAIEIARTFTYGGAHGRIIHNPDLKPEQHQTKESYLKHSSTTINHFYEKHLLLKDRMNTTTAKRIAQGRHQFAEQYLEEFYAEWEGKR